MDIPVMPHPGTDTQASPYQSRQTKETTNNLKQMNMKKKILTLLVLLMTAVTGAWAQEQSETIATTDNNVVEGTHFTISNGGEYADEVGMCAYGGITVTPKNGETITKVVISCTYGQDCVNDGTTSVSSGTKEITNGGETITVTGVNASTFTFTCSDDWPQSGQFVVYYTEAPAGPTESIDLTTTDNLTWTLASMPDYDVELEVEYETELALSETTDNSAALIEWDGYEADVTLTRTLAAGSYNTFAAPFSTVIPDGWTVKELTSATFADGTLTLNFANAASIEAGKPYLVKVAANTDLSTAPFTGAIVSKDAQPFTSTDVDFIPTLGATTIPDGDTKAVLFLAANNTLLNPSALPADMKGFRAYFQLKGETASLARAFSIDFGDGETTGIIAIGTDRAASTDNATYTLDGRRISKATQKGVYIQNGKKVIIRSATQGDAIPADAPTRSLCQSKK